MPASQHQSPKSDIEISQAAKKRPIIELAKERLGIAAENLYVLAETSLNAAIQTIQEMSPAFVVVDSVQTVYLDELESAAGSVGQLRECTMALMRLAKSSHIPVVLVGRDYWSRVYPVEFLREHGFDRLGSGSRLDRNGRPDRKTVNADTFGIYFTPILEKCNGGGYIVDILPP